ncbi:hypothetical protein EJP77_05510 [Paenibacillus zeisoli]|uniref:Uncharacterized protein n=1 Tax=Paenibacillus zeisoli TaxID=2496267 RepID=A0A3S1BBB2_9BACL|nr:hypothetical protein [Paenibacillus zeisoli]RUT36429.1 hypothetical protein EJP77_05510 [Paenibacillus zeisoli]
MNDLLEWVTSHLYLVIVIGFAVLSMLGKKGKPGGSSNRMPTFGGDPSRELNRKRQSDQTGTHTSQTSGRAVGPNQSSDQKLEEWGRNILSPSTAESWSQHEENSIGQKSVEIEEGREAAEIISLQRKLERLERTNRSLVRELKRKKDLNRQASNTSAERSPSLTSSQLANGVIWAEILGEPRAKRPYRYRK